MPRHRSMARLATLRGQAFFVLKAVPSNEDQ